MALQLGGGGSVKGLDSASSPDQAGFPRATTNGAKEGQQGWPIRLEFPGDNEQSREGLKKKKRKESRNKVCW